MFRVWHYTLVLALLFCMEVRADNLVLLTLHNLGCRQANHSYTGFNYPHTDWSEGDMVQIILAGPNRVIDPPQASGLPGGDDQLAANPGAQFGMNMDSFTHFPYTFYSPNAIFINTPGIGPANTLTIGSKWYVRCWNGPTIAQSTAYYNSRRLIRDFPLPVENCAMDSAVRTFPVVLTIPELTTYAVTLEDIGHAFTPPNSVTLITPNGGESVIVGDSLAIQWSASPAVTFVDLYLLRSGIPELIVADTPSDGIHQWLVTEPADSLCQVRVQWSSDTTLFDLSNSYFSIISDLRFLSIDSPQSGDTIIPGQVLSIEWTSIGFIDDLRILLQRESAVTETLFASTPNDGQESWVVTAPPAMSATLVIEATDEPSQVFSIVDDLTIADSTFAGPLGEPEIVLLASIGSVMISWEPVPNTATYRIENSLDFDIWSVLGSTSDTTFVVLVDSLAPLVQYFRVTSVR